MTNILSNNVLKKKISKTLKKVVKSKKFEKILKEVKQISNTNSLFWNKIIEKNKKTQILQDIIINNLLNQKNMSKILSYVYKKKIDNKEKKKYIKEKIIMQYFAKSTKYVVKFIKKKMARIKKN